ncbi:MAG: formylglycine-generating enzyme family protein [Kiritimatiellae bacterium]|nr:formylglycine-generating enzyme family protein [Kiritimatiellia bacterium]
MKSRKLSKRSIFCVCFTVMGLLAAEVPAGESFINSIGMKLALIPKGSYTFSGKPGVSVKLPVMYGPTQGFKVTIDRDFFLGVYEVTQAQYEKVMGKTPAFFKGPDHPVEKVSWLDAMEFCRRLSELPEEKKAGRVYSLPTEREWQYAARAGSNGIFPAGIKNEVQINQIAVCRDCYTDTVPESTAAVGTKKANNWGLFDTLGNVWEWVLDSQPDNSYINSTSAKNIVYDNGDCKVILGGGWDGDFRMANLAARYRAYPTKRADNIGFRVRCLMKTGE